MMSTGVETQKLWPFLFRRVVFSVGLVWLVVTQLSVVHSKGGEWSKSMEYSDPGGTAPESHDVSKLQSRKIDNGGRALSDARGAQHDSCAEAQYALQFFHLQDMSYSFTEDLDNMKAQIPDLLKEFESVYPHRKYGFATFIDKPFVFPLARDAPYCFRMHSPLSNNEPHFLSEIDALNRSMLKNGIDPLEGQLEAIFHASVSRKVGWSNVEKDAGGTFPVLKILSVSTDNGFHKAGDRLPNPDLRLRPNDGDDVLSCTEEDYPSVKQVADALRKHNIRILFLVTPNMLGLYRRLLDELEVAGYVAELQYDSSNIAKAITQGVQNITCVETALRFTTAPPLSMPSTESTNTSDDAATTTSTENAPPPQQEFTTTPFSFSNDRVELFHLQDASISCNVTAKAMVSQMFTVLEELDQKVGQLHVGLGTFVDKFLAKPLRGIPGDYCYRLHVPISVDYEEHDFSKYLDSFKALEIKNGGDYAEAQLEALQHVAMSFETGWFPPTRKSAVRVVRIILLVTDDVAHVAGDAATLRPNDDNEELDCVGEDYPTREGVKEALVKSNVHPIFAITRPEHAKWYKGLLNEWNIEGCVLTISENASNLNKLFQGCMDNLLKKTSL